MTQQEPMTRAEAFEKLGGTASRVALHIGVTPQAVIQWPDPLTPILRDRVQAALYRELMSAKRRRPAQAAK
jgi:hypothetical protein